MLSKLLIFSVILLKCVITYQSEINFEEKSRFFGKIRYRLKDEKMLKNTTWKLSTSPASVTIFKLIDFDENFTKNYHLTVGTNNETIKITYNKNVSVFSVKPNVKDIIIRLIYENRTDTTNTTLENVQFSLFYSTRDEVYSENKTCEKFELNCYDGKSCYDIKDACNSIFECDDHSDEINCGNCPENTVPCNSYSNKMCFEPKRQRCDGFLVCPQGEDELRCSSKCPDGLSCFDDSKCISKNQICNGIIDCKDDELDELNCTYRFCGNSDRFFLCDNHICVNESVLNNGFDDCGDGSDEKLENRTKITINDIIFITIPIIIIVLVLLCCFCSLVKKHIRNINRIVPLMPESPLSSFRDLNEDVDQRNIQVQYSEFDFTLGGSVYVEFVRVLARSEKNKRKNDKKIMPKLQDEINSSSSSQNASMVHEKEQNDDENEIRMTKSSSYSRNKESFFFDYYLELYNKTKPFYIKQ